MHPATKTKEKPTIYVYFHSLRICWDQEDLHFDKVGAVIQQQETHIPVYLSGNFTQSMGHSQRIFV
jgi:hypothetical protein